jgi:Zn-dependent protease
MQNSITLGRIAGIPFGVHYTWIFVAALLSWSLAMGYFPANYPGWSVTTYWTAGIIAAFSLFASVLIHEFGHSLVAKSRGVRVERITLFIFGGVAQMKEEAERPSDDFLISIAGPLTSFALAAVFWLGTFVFPAATPASAVLAYLAFINLLLGAFNLVPGFPLDGGRVLRSIIWGVTGSLRRATQVASYIGQGFGFLMLLWGVVRLLGGDTIGGLWIAVIGLFLSSAASASRQAQEVKEQLKGIRVADVMNPYPTIVSSDTSLQEFIYLYVLRQGRRALLVVDDNRLLGLVSITDAKEVAQPEWPTTTVGQVMTREPLKSVAPNTGLDTAMQRLVDGDINQLPVVEEGRVVGIVSRGDILRVLQSREGLRLEKLEDSPYAGRFIGEEPNEPPRRAVA